MQSRVLTCIGSLLLAVIAGSLTPMRGLGQAAGAVRGQVVDAATQRPLEGVQVGLVGTTLVVVSNQDGQYAILAVPAGTYQIAARRIGFGRQSQTIIIPTAGAVTANFALRETPSQLGEVVVTGTPAPVERRVLGHSVTSVDVGDLSSKTSLSTVTEALQSKTPGVTIMPNSGIPGAAADIRIRGASSISGYRPVVFIDGIRYNIEQLGNFAATGGGTAGLAQSSQATSALDFLNPNDIESIEVVKGPAATTLYGAEAAGGVIQIITKKGARGRQQVQWGFRAERGSNEWRLLPEDNYTTCDATKKAQTNADGSVAWPGCQDVPVNAVISDNPLRRDSRALRTGALSRAALSLRGGGETYSFYIAADRDVEQGVFYNSDNNRTSLRANFGFNPTPQSDITVTTNFQRGRLRLPIQDESANGLLLSARRGLPGRSSLVGAGNEGWRLIGPERANVYRNFTIPQRFTIGATGTYNPLSWFRNRVTVGLDNTDTQAQVLFLPGDIDVAQDPDAASGANLRRDTEARILTVDYAGTLLWSPRTSLQSTTSFGAQVIADRRESLGATGVGIGAPDVTLVNLLQRSTGNETFSENNSVGYFFQEQIGWNDRLFLIGAVRADDHSSFGTNFDWIIYPKFSLSYVASDDPVFTSLLDRLRINSLRFRGAWGQAGRAPTAYAATQTYTVDRVTLGAGTGSALRTFAFGNPNLEPERGDELDLGFETTIFNDRVGVDFTWYNKTTKNMLQAVSVPPSAGFISSPLTNLGEVKNSGIELAIFGTPFRYGSLAWDTRLMVSTNRNRLVSFGVPNKIVENPAGQAYGVVQQHREGYPLGGFWVTPPRRDEQGAAILTATNVAIFNPGDTARRYIGPSTPTREIGFSNTLSFANWVRLYALLDHKGGFYVFNLQERNRCQAANDNCLRVNNPRARFPETAADTVLWKELAVYRSTNISPEWIQKGDFIKLREISLSFDLPAYLVRRMANAQTASLVLSARNLAVWSDYEGVDPEVNSYGGRNFVRVDAYASPMMRRLAAAINVQF